MVSRDLNVLLGLRNKTVLVSKGSLFSDPVEVRSETTIFFSVADLSMKQEALRMKAESKRISDMMRTNVSSRADMITTQGAKPKKFELSVRELHADLADIRARETVRRMKRLGVSHLVESEEVTNSFLDKLGLLDVSEDEIKLKIRDVFDVLDTDGSGFLDQHELAEALSSFGLSLSAGDSTALLSNRGGNEESSATMSFSEFQVLVLSVRERTLHSQSNAKVKLDLMDENGPIDAAYVSAESSRATLLPAGESEAEEEILVSENSFASLESSSDSDEDNRAYWNGEDTVDAAIDADLKRPLQRNRLRSARSTNRYADDMLHKRLYLVERALERCVASEGRAVRRLFATAARDGRISYVAAAVECAAARALYSGGVDSDGRPDGIGCFDYGGYPRRGSVTGERRVYYAGCVEQGARQGLGLLRWIDGTEYAGGWAADAPHGAGMETYGDGSWFAGGFAADKRHGMGTLTMPESAYPRWRVLAQTQVALSAVD